MWFRILPLIGILTTSEPAYSQNFPSDPAHITSRLQEEVIDGLGLGVADTAKVPPLMPLAFDLIKDFEKWIPTAYNDASNFCTIGYGHLLAKRPCISSAVELGRFVQPLSYTSGLTLLDDDTKIARQGIGNLVKNPLSDEQFGALTSFVFNVGIEHFASSRLLIYLKNGEYGGAVTELPKWIKSKGKILDGLITRRMCEAALFRGDLRYGSDKRFHRDDCGSLGAAPPTQSLIDIDVGEK